MFATLSTRIGSISTLICGASVPIVALFAAVACCQVADLHAIEHSRRVGSQGSWAEASAQISVSSECGGTALQTEPASTRSALAQSRRASFKMVTLRRHCCSERQHSREFTSHRTRSRRAGRRRELSIQKSVVVNRSSHGITVPPSQDSGTGEQLFDPDAPPAP